MHTETLIIIPAYNEERSISGVVSSIKEKYRDIDVVVINDGSNDNTAELAGKAGAFVLSHVFNMGYGISIQTGYKYAIYNNYKYLVQIDGDGQHDIKGIEILLEKLKNGSADIVLGSRFLKSNNYRLSIYRFMGIRFFQFFLRLLTGLKISDPTTGFQAMNRKVLKIFAQDYFPYDYPDADVIILLSKMNMKLEEVAVSMYPNQEGKSMHSSFLGVVYYIFKMLLSMFLTKYRRF